MTSGEWSGTHQPRKKRSGVHLCPVAEERISDMDQNRSRAGQDEVSHDKTTNARIGASGHATWMTTVQEVEHRDPEDRVSPSEFRHELGQGRTRNASFAAYQEPVRNLFREAAIREGNRKRKVTLGPKCP